MLGNFKSHMFNANNLIGRIPAMAIQMGGTEWLSDLVDLEIEHTVVSRDGRTETRYMPIFLSSNDLPFKVDSKHVPVIPNIVGGNFFKNLKGLVFDFTPNKERVGFVPRYQFTSATGLVNPLTGSAAGRAHGHYNISRYIAASLVVMLACIGGAWPGLMNWVTHL
jgi:hypothetical protein